MLTMNNVTVDNSAEYEAKATLEGQGARQVSFTVTGAAVYYSLKLRKEPGVPESGWEWSPDIFIVPTFQSLPRVCSGVRFKAVNSEEPAQVSAQLLTAADTGLSG